MPLRRRNEADRELATLDSKVEAARSGLEERRRSQRKCQADHDLRLSGLAADLGLGELTPETYEVRRAELAERLAVERDKVETAELVVRALSERAAALARKVAEDRVSTAERDLARTEGQVADAEAVLDRGREERDRARDRLAIVRREALDLPAPYDEAVAANAAAREAQDEEQVAYFAPLPLRDSEVPVHLRERVAARRAEKEAEFEAARERSKTDPGVATPEEAFADGVRPGGSFPRFDSPL